MGADKESSGDKTAVQFGLTGKMVAHDWETLGFREDKYKLENQRIRQAFYDALTSELGDLNKLPKAVRATSWARRATAPRRYALSEGACAHPAG